MNCKVCKVRPNMHENTVCLRCYHFRFKGLPIAPENISNIRFEHTCCDIKNLSVKVTYNDYIKIIYKDTYRGSKEIDRSFKFYIITVVYKDKTITTGLALFSTHYEFIKGSFKKYVLAKEKNITYTPQTENCLSDEMLETLLFKYFPVA